MQYMQVMIQASTKRPISLQIKLPILIAIIMQTVILGLSSSETPLMDPSINARQLALARTYHSEPDFNNLHYNPSAIVNTNGISIYGINYQAIDYSSILYAANTNEWYYGIQYTGSSLSSVTRSYVENSTDITEIDSTVQYEYHAFNVVTATTIYGINIGGGLTSKTIILDDTQISNIYALYGCTIRLWNTINIGVANHHMPITIQDTSAFLVNQQISIGSISYQPTEHTLFIMGLINNPNEYDFTTFHYSIEHFLNRHLAIRIGLDHNRITSGIGLNLTPLTIDIGWGQSRDTIMEDQIVVSFSYDLAK